MSRRIWSLIILFLASGCHRSEEQILQVSVVFPSALAHNTARYRRFVERASHAVVFVKTKAGAQWTGTFSVAQWKNLAVPRLNFPQSPEDLLSITIEFWDRDKAGLLRTQPTLSGSQSVSPAQFEDRRRRISILLKLTAPASDFD